MDREHERALWVAFVLMHQYKTGWSMQSSTELADLFVAEFKKRYAEGGGDDKSV